MDIDTIKMARQSNLAEYLMSIGVPLVKNGSRYKHKEHDSLTFTKNSYYWNSRQEHGNAIDYLVRHMGMSFKDAVAVLLNQPVESSKADGPENSRKIFDIRNIKLCDNNDRVYSYLNEVRNISHETVSRLIKSKLLFQEEQTNNALYLIYDEKKNCVGAEVQGTLAAKRFKGIKAGSKYGYGFNVRFTDSIEFKYALFFESAVDLTSFIDYVINYTKGDLTYCILTSMAGLKLNVFKNTLKVFKGELKPILCVDNDQAGKNFIDEIVNENIVFNLRQPDKKYKDWNEQLSAVREKIE